MDKIIKNRDGIFSESGFMLIELLVVVSVIGFLVSASVYYVNLAATKARDAKRMADVKQIETAMRLYFHDNNFFPGNTDNDSSGWDCGGSSFDNVFIQPLVSGNYMKFVPIETKKNMGCFYRYYNYGNRVILGVQLELPQIVPDNCDPYQSWVSDSREYCIDFLKNN